jgi:release factor glutamine methyltransferase
MLRPRSVIDRDDKGLVMADTTWTIQKLITWTTQHFAKLGLDSPRLDAELLLAHAMNCSRTDLMVRFHEEPTEVERKAFRQLVEQRTQRWPTAYLIGRREFYLLPFAVTPAVLIPRPDTETLVQTVIEKLTSDKAITRPHLLDLGTGSGCIAITLAHRIKSATVVAVDVSPDAAAVAKQNATTSQVGDRVTIHVGDLFAAVPSGSLFDVIVSNPPYISSSEIPTLMPEVRDHEPRLALDGGPDGLAFYRRIAAEAARWLKPNGWLIVEIGSQQADGVGDVFRTSGWAVGRTIKDNGGLARVIVAHRAASA